MLIFCTSYRLSKEFMKSFLFVLWISFCVEKKLFLSTGAYKEEVSFLQPLSESNETGREKPVQLRRLKNQPELAARVLFLALTYGSIIV